jgi:hypothetical protein
MKKITLAAIISLVLLTSCVGNPNGETDENIYYLNAFMSVGEQFILYSGDLLEYVDFTSGDMAKKPLCSKPNCEHKSENCAAYSLRAASSPFIYNEKLYYFKTGYDENKSNSFGYFCQAETDGTNQKTLFKSEIGWFIAYEQFTNGKLIFYAFENGLNNVRNYRVYLYDFSKVTLIFETGMKYNSGITVFGIIGNELFCEYRGRDYPIEIPADKLLEYMTDKNSVYYQDFAIEIRKIPLSQKDPLNPEYEVIYPNEDGWLAILDDANYYFSNNEIYLVNDAMEKIEKIDLSLITEDADLVTLFTCDDKLFVRTGNPDEETGFWKNFRDYCYDGSEFMSIGDELVFNIAFGTEEYFFGYFYDITEGYIKKSDYYSENWDGFAEFNWG